MLRVKEAAGLMPRGKKIRKLVKTTFFNQTCKSSGLVHALVARQPRSKTGQTSFLKSVKM
jgi:hypothetical protein